MNDIAAGLSILEATIIQNLRHRDYERVTYLADLYLKLFTGENIETLLKRFAKREDPEMFEQRKALYQSVMPSVAGNLTKTFVKPLRSNRVYSTVDHTDEKRRSEILDRKMDFWHGDSESGVDAYLRSRWLDLVKLDPNAFVTVEFDAFNSNVEKAKPYPVEYSSAEAINYKYKNGVLDWLIVERKINYKTKVGEEIRDKEGSRFVLYLENEAVVYTEVDPEYLLTDIVDPVFTTLENKGSKRVFVAQIFRPVSGRVPAVRVGFDTDATTQARTCLSIFHAAVPFFKKELKAGSELDISMALHAFPQKIQYGKRCEGDKANKIICNDGKLPNGGDCPVCHGTKVAPVHTSGQDILIVPMPRKDETFQDLDKLLVYKSPDIALIKFQDEYVDRLTEKARKAVFGGTTQIQKEGLKTATEVDYAMEDTYDTLKPFADKYSAMWLFIMGLIATYTDNAGKALTLYHRFPNDFKMKGLIQLFTERKEAKDAGAPQSILDAIDNDIMELQYADDQDTLIKIRTKNKFLPFSGKSSEEISTIIAGGQTTQFFAVLYNHFEIIFDRIENEMNEPKDKFYLLSYDLQLKEVQKQVQIIVDQIKNETTAKIPLPIEGDQFN